MPQSAIPKSSQEKQMELASLVANSLGQVAKETVTETPLVCNFPLLEKLQFHLQKTLLGMVELSC